MVIQTHRKPSLKEQIRRRFHSDVRKLKRRCESLGITLMTYPEAFETNFCILSSNDYEIGEIKANCSLDSENYFVSEDDYITLTSE